MDSVSMAAVISLKDRLSAGLKRAGSNVDSFAGKLGSLVGSGAALQVGMKAVNYGLSTMSSHLSSAIARVDTMNNFPKVMSNMGFSTKESAAAVEELSEGISGLPTSLDDITSSAQSIALITGDLPKATKTALALNDAFLAGGQGSEAASRGLLQYNQMLAKNKVDAQSWNSVVETMGPALNKVAEAFGYTGAAAKQELYSALQDGTITFEQLNDKIIELDDGVGGFAEMAKASTGGIATSMQNLGTAVTRGLANCITAIDEALEANNMPTIAESFAWAQTKINEAFDGIKTAIGNANLQGVLAGITPYVDAFKATLEKLVEVGKPVVSFINDHAEIITKLVVGYLAAGPAIKLMRGGISKLSSAFSMLKGTSAVQQTITSGASDIGASATNYMKLGLAVMEVGAGIALAGAGIWLMANAAIQLAAAGPGAVAVMVGMVAAIAGLAYGASLLGTALTAGAVGFIAFGAAIALIGVGVLAACAGVKLLATAIPTIAESGGAAALALVELGAAIAAFSLATAACAPVVLAVGAGMLVLGAGLLVVSAGAFAATGAMGLLSALIPAITKASAVLATIIPKAATALAGFAVSAVSAGAAGGVSAVGLGAFALAAVASAAGALILSVSLLAVAATMKSINKSATSSAKALTEMVSGVNVVSVGFDAIKSKAKDAMKSMLSSFTSGAKSATSAGKAIGKNFSSGVKEGLTKSVTLVKTALITIKTTLTAGAAMVTQCGVYISQGLAAGMRSALSEVRAAGEELAEAANKAVRAKAKIASPSKVMKKNGNWLARGLAVGMTESTDSVANAAGSLIFATIAKMESVTKKMWSRDYTSTASSAINTFKKKVTSKVESLQKSISKVVKKYNLPESVGNKWSKALTKEGNKLINKANKQLTKLAEKYQEKYDAIIESRNSMLSSLRNYGSLYSSDSYGFVKLTDFAGLTSKIKAITNQLSRLQDLGVSQNFIDQITSMDTTSQSEFLSKLLSMTPSEVQAYARQFDTYWAQAQEASNTVYSPYIQQLDTKYNKALQTALGKLKTEFLEIGSNASDGLIKGLTDKSTIKKIKNASKTLSSTIVSEVKKALKIHSPSRVMANLGVYTGEGFANGIESTIKNVKQATAEMLSIPSFQSPALTGNYSAGLNDAYSYGNANFTVTVPVDIDGKQIAKVTAPYTDAELGKRSKRSNRLNGVR